MYYMLAAPARAGDCYCSCTQAQAEHADLREARAHAVVRVLGVKVAAAVANTNRLELVVLDLDCAGHELAAQVRARRCRAALSQLLAGILEAVLPLLALVSDAPVVTFAGAFPAVEDKATRVRDHAARERLLDATRVAQAAREILDGVVLGSHPLVSQLELLGAVRCGGALLLLVLESAVREADALLQLVVPERRVAVALTASHLTARIVAQRAVAHVLVARLRPRAAVRVPLAATSAVLVEGLGRAELGATLGPRAGLAGFAVDGTGLVLVRASGALLADALVPRVAGLARGARGGALMPVRRVAIVGVAAVLAVRVSV